MEVITLQAESMLAASLGVEQKSEITTESDFLSTGKPDGILRAGILKIKDC